MIVYGTSVSPYVRKVLVSLFEKDVAFDHKPVPFHADDPGFQAASPLGKIPALDDDGFLLADSSAILHYIEAKHPSPVLIPTEAKARGRAVWFDKYGDTELFPVLIVPFVERFLKPRLMKQEGDEAKAQATINEKFPPLLDYIEAQIEGDYLVGGAFSIADIAVATNFHNLRLANFEVDGGRWPKLAAWVAKTLDRPSFVKAIAAAKN
ncbi:glutathione S-transferase family protein [Methylobacterium aerolatum]|uniref:Glutathione S-transferase n=1 Tax=Methylobacterium aerolatum TaxID=418708 RepID=A0ABU0I3B4_9HYPH|nr:glutathione S-transferase family protein [Methylobacterium aerolatum]MDQ0449091.1 glutathione S-transferase [Methylobacterium aerolatum]GJD35279.1 putative GST-like protein YibF [Methylobacterium aerolatum]